MFIYLFLEEAEGYFKWKRKYSLGNCFSSQPPIHVTAAVFDSISDLSRLRSNSIY